MILNIITPCSRPQNLHTIAESINIPKENYRWIVVFDFPIPPDNSFIPSNCETYCYQMKGSIVGHAQRNFAMALAEKGHIYFNDDDTCIHPELWENIKDCDEHDFISFMQGSKTGLRLNGDRIGVGSIDSHNFIVSKELVRNKSFYIDRYDADGYFAEECYADAKNKLYIPKILSIYNFLRP